MHFQTDVHVRGTVAAVRDKLCSYIKCSEGAGEVYYKEKLVATDTLMSEV